MMFLLSFGYRENEDAFFLSVTLRDILMVSHEYSSGDSFDSHEGSCSFLRCEQRFSVSKEYIQPYCRWTRVQMTFRKRATSSLRGCVG